MKKIYFILASILTLTCLQVVAQTPYFYNGAGVITNVTSWGLNTDGSGANPANFTADDQIFNVVNGAGSATLSANWVVSGLNSRIVIGDGVVPFNLSTSTFTITGLIDISNLGTFTVQSTTSPFTLGTLSAGSTVNYALDGTQAVRTGVYHNLTLSNATAARTKTASGAITVNGTLDVETNNTLAMTTSLLSGSLTSILGTGIITTTNTSTTPIPAGKTWTQTVSYGAATSGVSDGTYENLTIITTGTKTAQGNIVVNASLNVTATLAMSTFTLSGAFTPVGAGTISTANVSATPFPSGYTWTQTVSYLAGATTVRTGTYQILSVTGAGTKSTDGDITVNGTLTVTTGTLNLGTNLLFGAFTPSSTGTIQTANTSATPIPVGKTWTQTLMYNSASSQTVVHGTYAALNTTGGDRVFSNADSIRIGGTFTTGAGALDFTGTSIALRGGTQALTITGQTAITFNNLSVSLTGTKTFSSTAATITINGVLNIPGPATFLLAFATNKLVLGMGATLAGGGGISTTCILTDPLPSGITWPYTVTYSSTASNFVASGTYLNLTISGGGTATANGDITVTNNLAVSGTFALSTFRIISVGGTITNSSTISTAYTAGNDAFPSGKTWPGTVSYLAAGNQTIVDGTYTNLSVSGGGSFVKTAMANLTVTGVLTTVASTIIDLATFQLLSTTTITNAGTIRTQNTSSTPIPAGKTIAGTVEYNAAGSQTVVDGTYTNLNISGGTRDLSGLADITISGVLTATTGTINGGTSNVRLTGGNANISLGAAGSFNNFRVVGTGTRTVVASTGALVVDGELEVHSIRTLALQDNQLLGAFATNVGTGTITTTRATAAVPAGKTWTLTVSYSGTTQEVSDGTYRRLLIAGTLTKTALGNISVSDTLSIVSPLDMSTFTLGGAITTLLGTATLTTANTSATPIPAGKTWLSTTVFYNSASSQTVVNGQYVALNLTGGDRVLSSTDSIRVTGTFTAGAGTYIPGTSNFVLNGTGAQSFIAGGQTFHNFSITLGLVKTVTIGGFNVDGELHVVSSATLAMGTFQLGGTLTAISGSGIITTANTGATPIPAGKTWTQTVNYTTSSQTVVGGTYNNLTLTSNTTTKTASGDINITNNLTFAGNSSTILFLGTNLLTGIAGTISGVGQVNTQNISATPIPAGKTWTQTVLYSSVGNHQTVVDGTYLALNVAGGDRTFSTMANINIGGTFTANTGSAVYTTTGTTIVFTSAAAQALTLAANFPFENVSFTGGNTKTLGVAISVAGTLNIATGVTVNMATFALSGATLTPTGGGLLRTQNTSATPIPTAKTWSFRLQFDANGNQTIPLGVYSGGLYGTGTSSVRTKTLAGSITVGDTLSITTSFATLVLNGNSLVLNGVINPAQTGTITGSATSSIIIGSNAEDAGILNMTQIPTAARTLNNLTLSRATGPDAVILGNELHLIGVLTLNDGTLASNGNLVFVSSAPETSAQVDVVTGTGNVSGNVVVQRFIDGQPVSTNVRWRFLASSVNTSNGIDDNWQQQILITGAGSGGTFCPAITANSNGFDATTTSSPSFYTRNPATDAWVALPNTNATELETGVGYRVFYRGTRTQNCDSIFNGMLNPADTTLVATGTLAIGPQSIIGPVVASRYALVGNPYQATIDWESPSITLSNLSNTISTLRPNSVNGSYGYYTVGIGGTNGMTQYMAPGQAFWIQASSNGASSLDIAEGAKVVAQGGFAFFKNQPVVQDVLRIKLMQDGVAEYLDEVIVAKRPNTSWDYNSSEEGGKLGFTTHQMQLLIPGSTAKYAICAVPDFTLTHNRIDIDAKTVIGNSYSFNFSGMTTFDASLGFTLYDTYTGTTQDLRVNPEYTYTTPDAASILPTRFYIIFDPNANPLPVSLIAFKAERTSQNHTILAWKTASEQGSDRFEIERSVDAKTFAKIGVTKAAKQSNKIVNYLFTDIAPYLNTTNYYRLKQIDANGEFAYSQVVSVTYNQVAALSAANIVVYPVPATDVLVVEVKDLELLDNPTLSMVDMYGKELSVPTEYVNGKWTLQTAELNKGIYIVTLVNKGTTTQLKVLKN